MANSATEKVGIPAIQNTLPLDKTTGHHPPGFLVGLTASITCYSHHIKLSQSLLQPKADMPIVDGNVVVDERENIVRRSRLNHLVKTGP